MSTSHSVKQHFSKTSDIDLVLFFLAGSASSCAETFMHGYNDNKLVRRSSHDGELNHELHRTLCTKPNRVTSCLRAKCQAVPCKDSPQIRLSSLKRHQEVASPLPRVSGVSLEYICPRVSSHPDMV